jgi:hypothetical protein
MKQVVFFFALFISGQANAQSRITGTISIANNQPLTDASVLLLHANDSSLVKGVLADIDGRFFFENISAGTYNVSAAFAGYKQFFTDTFNVTGNATTDLGRLSMIASFSKLDEVTVTGRKNLFEAKPGRLVINIQSNASAAGSSVLDILERSPGVLVDRQNNTISLRGKDGVSVSINGKLRIMPAETLLELLKGMPSANIEKIELITMPPANMDANGNGGFINIVLKPNDNLGVNGAYTLTAGYATGLLEEATSNINYRNKKINIYGSLSYTFIRKPLPIDVATKIPVQGSVIENRFSGDRIETNRVINAQAGLDYTISRKTVAGILVSGYQSKYTHYEHNENRVLKNNRLDTLSRQANDEVKTWKNISVNLNVLHRFTPGSSLSADIDHAYYKNEQPYNYYAAFCDGDGRFLFDSEKRSMKVTPVAFWIGALAYKTNIGKKALLETGVKRTVARFSNDLQVERYEMNNWKTDTASSAAHYLRENYTALYVSLNLATSKKSSLKAGLRYEYSNYKLDTANNKNRMDLHYGNLFPVITYSHQLGTKSNISVSFNRRIMRPTFNDLAPYTYFINESTLITGNPALQPSFSNTVTADYTFKKYALSLSFSKEKNVIAAFQPTIDFATGKTVFTAANLPRQQLLSATVSVPVVVNNWWTMQYNFTATRQQVITSRNNIHFNAVESFRLPRNINIDISGFCQSARLAGINTQKAFGSLDMAVKKKLAGNKGTLSFAAVNILDTQGFTVTNDYAYMHVNFTQRIFRLTYARSFGNNKLQQKRERVTGAEEEKGRVQ